MLSDKHVEKYCLPFDGNNCCRYLMEDEVSGHFFCAKLTAKKQFIDMAAEDEINSNSPSTKAPLGNNCKGYPYLQYIKQGFDQD